MAKMGGGLLDKKIKCGNCGWEWKAADGGSDVMDCHKCGGKGLVKAQTGGEKKWLGNTLDKNGYITSTTKGGNYINFTGNQRGDAWINKQIDSGKFGFDPKTGGTFPLKKPVKGLSKEEQFMGTEEYHDLRAPEGFTSESQQAEIEKLPEWQQDMLNAENTNRRKKVVYNSMQDVVKNPLFYAPGAIALAPIAAAGLTSLGTAAAPYVTSALATQLPGMATVPGATVGNAITAGFAGHGLANVGPDAVEMYKNPSWQNAFNLAMDVAEVAPVAGPLTKSVAEGYNITKQGLTKGVELAKKVPYGETAIPYAWKSRANQLGQIESQEMFNTIKQNEKLTEAEKVLLAEYQYDSTPFTGSGYNGLGFNPEKKQALQEIINKVNPEFQNNTVLTRRIHANDSKYFNQEDGIIKIGDRPTSFSTGLGADGFFGPDRFVVSGRNAKAIESKFLKNPYEELTPETIENLQKFSDINNTTFTGKPYTFTNSDGKIIRQMPLETNSGFVNNLNQTAVEKELIGAGFDFKQLGKVKNDFGGHDYIVKPINIKNNNISNVLNETQIQKQGFPNPLSIVDKVVPRPPTPGMFLGMEDSWNNYSPFNLIPGYGNKLSGKSELFDSVIKTNGRPKLLANILEQSSDSPPVAFRKFGNSIQDVIESQSLRPKGTGMGSSQIMTEGNWAQPGSVNENYSGVFEATMNPNVRASNIKLEQWNKRNGVVGTTNSGDVAIPLTDTGLSFNRRLPFSNRYIPIDKEKLINNQFQLSTQLPYVQSLLEKYGLWAGGAGAAGYIANGEKGAKENINVINKYTIDPIIDNLKPKLNEASKNFQDLLNSTQYQKGGEKEDTSWTAYLNPANWGTSRYDDAGTFKEAFRAARNEGDSDFLWKGERYSTELKVAPKTPAKPKGITPELLIRQAYRESAFNPNIVSPAGYKGLGQIGDAVIKDYKKANNITGNIDPFNIKQNSDVQKYSMNELYNSSFINKPGQSENVRLAKTLASYNWGRGNVMNLLNDLKEEGVDIYNSLDWISKLPEEPRNYINDILLQKNTTFNTDFSKALGNQKNKPIKSLYGFKDGGESKSGPLMQAYNRLPAEKKMGGAIDYKQGGGQNKYSEQDGNVVVTTKKVDTPNGPRFYQAKSPNYNFSRELVDAKAITRVADSIPKVNLDPRILKILNERQFGGQLNSGNITMYKDYINGNIGNEEQAVKNYDKLNRIYYSKAKELGMTAANYIMTYIVGNS
jgi:DNA-directed RNA polymerase subunit RPC12/RpoP